MPTAFNKETGELLVLDQTGQWSKPKMAVNPQTREKLYLDGNEWKPAPLNENEYGAGLAASVLQGPLLGAADEITSALANPISATRAAFGYEDKNGDYYKSLNQFRDTEARFRQANPWTAFGATTAGGLVGGGLQLGKSAFGLAQRALPNASRLTQAAATGAGFGAAAGFNSGEGGLGERITSGVTGAGAGAALGAGFELAAPVVAGLYRMVRGNPALWDDQAGRFTPAGERAAQEAGLDPAEASTALQQEFAREASRAVNPEQAAAVAEARTLPVPVQLRRGQSTLDPSQQMFESDAGKGVYGQLAQETIRGSEEAQQAALRGNVRALQERLGGGRINVQERGQGTNMVQEGLANAAEASRRNVNTLYGAARDAGGQASVGSQDVAQALFGLRQGLEEEGLSAVVAGRVHTLIDRAAENLQGVVRGVIRPDGRPPNINVGDLFTLRRQLTSLQGSSDGVERAAAGNARRALDGWLDNAIESDLIRGEPGVVQMWRDAIAARRQHGQTFEANDFVAKLVERSRDGTGTLKLDPNAAANLIFGSSKTGWVTRSGMIRSLQNMRQILGPNSQAWNALREEAFMRLASAGEGASQPGTGRDFSGANFLKAFENTMQASPEVMRMMFTRDELATIQQFARVANRVTTPVRGGANFSNTGASVAGAMKRLFASTFMGPRMAAFLDGLPIVRGLSNIGNEMRAQRAVLNRMQRGYRPVDEINQAVGPAAAAGGAAAAQNRRY